MVPIRREQADSRMLQPPPPQGFRCIQRLCFQISRRLPLQLLRQRPRGADACRVGGIGRRFVALLLALLAVGLARGSPQEPPTFVSPAKECEAQLRRDELAAAEECAVRLLEDFHAVTRQDSLVVMEATGVLIEARLRRGLYDDPELPGRIDAMISMCESLRGPQRIENARAHQYAAVWAKSHHDYTTAIEHYRIALEIVHSCLGDDHPEAARALNNLATAYFQEGNYIEALDLFEEVLRVHEQQPVHDPLDIANSLINLVETKIALRDTSGVGAQFARARTELERLEGPYGRRLAGLLHREARWRMRLGEMDAAARLLDRAIAIREAESPGSCELAASLVARAHVDLELGGLDRAFERGARALEICCHLTESACAERARSLLLLGNVERQRSHYEAAMARYDEVLETLRGVARRDHEEIAGCLRAMAGVSQRLARYDQALQHARDAFALCRGHFGSFHYATAITRVAYASALRSVQQPDSASIHFERAIADLECIVGPDDVALAEPLLGLGALAREQGDLPRARTYVERALAIRQKAYEPTDPRLVRCFHELGILQRRLGDETAAQVSLDRALQTARNRGADSAVQAAIHTSLAALKRVRGDEVAAEKHLRDALAVLDRSSVPEHPQRAQVLRNLASFENAAGRFEEAEAHYQRALEILSSSMPDHPDVAATHLGLGNSFRARGLSSYAEEHYRRAIEIHRRSLGSTSPALALDYYNLAGLLLESGDLQAAMDTAAVAEELGQHHLRLVMLGTSEREALHFAASRASGLEIVLTCAARSESPEDWAQAWDLVIRSRAVVLEEMANRRRGLSDLDSDPAIDEFRRQLRAASGRMAALALRGRGSLSQEAYREQLEEARRDKEVAERALAERSESFRQQQLRQKTGFTDVQAVLPSGSALIGWVRFDRLEQQRVSGHRMPIQDRRDALGDPTYAAFVLEAGKPRCRFVVLGSAREIDAQIAHWHKEAGSGTRRRRDRETAQCAYVEAGRRLRRTVWDPVAAGLEDAERIFLVPDGALALVNVNTLPNDSDGYLLEEAPLLLLLSSERDLLADDAPPRCGYGLLTAAAPDYQGLPASHAARAGDSGGPAQTRGLSCEQFRHRRFGPLPGTRAEQDEVAKLWKKHGTKLERRSGQGDPAIIELAGSQVSERAFKQNAPGRRIIHVATHGFFLGKECRGREARAGAAPPDDITLSGFMLENPLLLSGLALAGANKRADAPGPDDDGILTAEEIAALDLTGVDCVVLSACETGLGKVEAGEGVFGLRRAFLMAGAHSIVMSLWAVDDDATAEWMERMFEELLRRRRSVAEAVRVASLKVLRRRRDAGDPVHPFYWGAFVSTGHWRPAE